MNVALFAAFIIGAPLTSAADDDFEGGSAFGDSEKTAAPASASSSSWFALAAPLTPTPPTTCPSTTIGIPPINGVNPSTAVIAVRPLLISSSKKRVGFLKRTAVRALPTEIVAPIAKVPS